MGRSKDLSMEPVAKRRRTSRRARPRVCHNLFKQMEHQRITLAKKEAMEAADRYDKRFSADIKAEVAEIEDKLREDVDEVLLLRIPDTQFSRTRDTKFFRMVELYWYTKSFIALVIEENKSFIALVIEEKGFQKTIMDKLNLMKEKFDAMIKALRAIEGVAAEEEPEDQHRLTASQSTS